MTTPSFFRTTLFIRHLFFVVLLAVEIGVLSIQFDTQSFEKIKIPLLDILGYSSAFLKVALSAVGAYIILSISRIKKIWNSFIPHAEHANWKFWGLLHLLFIAGLYALSYQIFNVIPTEEITDAFIINLTVIGWLLIGMSSLFFWLLVFAPYPYWVNFASQEWRVLAISVLSGFLAWLLGQFSEMAWQFFSGLTFWASQSTLQIFYSDVVLDVSRKILGTRSFKVIISSECSGYEGIGLVVVFLSLYLWMARDKLRFPHAYILFPIGVVAIWVLNIARIVALIAIGTSWSKDIAIGGFHSNAGWLAFVIISIGLVCLCQSLTFFNKNISDKDEVLDTPVSGALATVLILPLVILLAVLLVTSAFVTEFDWLYPLRIIAAGSVLWVFRSSYQRYVKNVTKHSIFIGIIVFILWIVLVPHSESLSSKFSLELFNAPPLWLGFWLLIRVLGACVVVPIAEELAFRGYLINKLVHRRFERVEKGHFTWWSFVVSSLLFGSLHSEWFAGTVAGMFFAVALYRRGEVFDAVIAHMTANVLLASYIFLTGHWSLW